MNWQHFGHDALPALPVPLVDTEGETVTTGDFRGKHHLVLLFLHALDTCQFCSMMVEQLIARSRELDDVDARVLIVQPPGTVARRSLPPSLRLVWDQQGTVRSDYAKLLRKPVTQHQIMVFVLDRYGTPQSACSVNHGDDKTLIQEALEYLDFITIQCPE